MSIGDNIKKIRKERNLTQEKFSKKAGISRSYLGDLENNRKNPSTETLEKISKKLGVSTTYLNTGRKTLKDLTEEELKDQWKTVQSNAKAERIEFAKALKGIDPDNLTFMQEMFLKNAVNFSSDYFNINNGEYLKTFAVIFRLLDLMYNVYKTDDLSIDEKKEGFNDYLANLNEEKDRLNFEQIADIFISNLETN